LNESREDLPHPEGEVGGCGSQEEVDAVALLALEEVATEAEVAFEMADAGFNGSPSAEAGPGLASLVGRVALLWSLGGNKFGFSPVGSAPVTPICDGQTRRVPAKHLHLSESLPEGVTIVVVFGQTVGSEDHSSLLAHKDTGLGSRTLPSIG